MTPPNEAGFSAFYDTHVRALWGYVYRVTGHAGDADDIVQESFLRLLRTGPATEEDEPRRRYVYRVASNLVVDRWRRRRGEEGTPIERTDMVLPLSEDRDVARTFAQLRPRERALLWLAYVEDERHDEIAAALGVGKSSVKVMLFRAKQRLRDLLKSRGLGT